MKNSFSTDLILGAFSGAIGKTITAPFERIRLLT